VPVKQILELTDGEGADKGCECVGYQAHDPQGEEHAHMTMGNLIESYKYFDDRDRGWTKVVLKPAA
jgi:threonine dehydrogenase-like Zn-dependent dehydrogenase